jgi:hypothetical protein
MKIHYNPHCNSSIIHVENIYTNTSGNGNKHNNEQTLILDTHINGPNLAGGPDSKLVGVTFPRYNGGTVPTTIPARRNVASWDDVVCSRRRARLPSSG